MTPVPELMDLQWLLAEVTGRDEAGLRFFLAGPLVSYRMPEIRPNEPFARHLVRVSGSYLGPGRGGAWAALAAPETATGYLTGPVMVWRGVDQNARDVDQLETRALATALAGIDIQNLGLPVMVSLQRPISGFGLDMSKRLRGWRDAGWIGDRWTKIPNVDLWRQIDDHARALSASWWLNTGQQPDAWQAIVTRLAERALAPQV